MSPDSIQSMSSGAIHLWEQAGLIVLKIVVV